MTVMVPNAVSVSSNFSACIIHEYFNLVTIISHNMADTRGEGKIGWEGVTSMYDDMNTHQELPSAVCD